MINILLNTPLGLKDKIISSTNKEYINQGKVEVVVLFGENVDLVKKDTEAAGAEFEDLGFGFGIITINSAEIEKLNTIRGIIYAELPKTLFTTNLASNKASCINQLWSSNGLSGEGVLVGFIDTGIDYTHPAFKDDRGNTRIDYIYDLSQKGKVYTKQDINLAIKSDNPLSIVNEFDETGHGTHVAAIACGGGDIPIENRGAAYNSSIAMVKTTRYGNINYALSTQIMRGVKFLIDKSVSDLKPLVINMSMSTNNGAHNGSSLLEQYIETISRLERVTMVVAAGNEGDAAHHNHGELNNTVNVNFVIAKDENSLVLQLYKPLLVDVDIEIINPLGASTGPVTLVEGFRQVRAGLSECLIYNTGPKPFDINGEIIITILPPSGEQFTGGSWKLKITNTSQYHGQYNIWMPISESLNLGTKFLQPCIYNTLGIPATVKGVISVGSYNYLTNNLSTFSGRGNRNECTLKPDIVAPGNDILSAVPGWSYDTKTGTSMAAPHVSGAAALLMQWGIVEKNDQFLYGDRLKYYLLKGAKRNRADVEFPDPSWGYGELCANTSLDILRLNIGRGGGDIIKQSKMTRQESKYLSPDYRSVLVEITRGVDEALKKYPDTELYKISERYGVFTAPKDDVIRIADEIKEIVHTEIGAVYTLTDTSPVDASNAPLIEANPYLNLTGRGVIIGIIDTGIDYLNDEFINEDGTTRIISIWDQTIDDPSKQSSDPPAIFGSQYTRDDINKAIAEKKAGRDPYAIVPSVDTDGHGTAMASLIGAKGKNPDVIGVAPDCQFVIVKLKEIKEFMIQTYALYGGAQGRYQTVDIVFAVRYLERVAFNEIKPMVIYCPLGTNDGSHDGSGIVEKFLNTASENRGIIPVTSTGNQADKDIHTSGVIAKKGDTKVIELKVGPLQKNLMFSIWLNRPNKVSVSVTSPSGEISEVVRSSLKIQVTHKFVYEGTEMTIKIDAPEDVTGDEKILVTAHNIREGIWKFNLTGEYIVECEYNAWLPQASLMAPDTKFLNPNQYVTLTIPSTADDVISVAFYNQNNNFIVPSSGRGYTRDGRVKPSISAGGVNASVTTPGGQTAVKSGASVGGAIVAGCCALMLQWGIVENNDYSMYVKKMKAYLIRGTTQRPGDTYPNRESGYGFVNMEGVFDNLRSVFIKEKKKKNDYIEYDVGKLHVKIPR